MRRYLGILALAAAVLIVAAFAATASTPAAQASWWNVQRIADHIKYHSGSIHFNDPVGEPPIGNNGRDGDIIVRKPDGERAPLDGFNRDEDEIWLCDEPWCFGELIEGDPFIPGDGWVRVWFKPLFRGMFIEFDTPDQVTTESSDYIDLVNWVVHGNPASEYNACTYAEWWSNQQ